MRTLKVHLDDLAILGGTPAFAQPRHVGSPHIGDRRRLLERLNDILDRRWLTNNGVYVQAFERRITEFLGVRHCIATCNGTVALEIASRALGLQGEVIVPSFTFIATAHAIQWQGIRPVFCDIDPATYTLDPDRVETLVTPSTSGIIGVHVWGRACQIEDLVAIARRRNLKLLFDAAHAFACSYRGRMIGNFGDAEVFSFHATKLLNTFEGGAIVTNDDELAQRIRLMTNFGFTGYDTVIHLGTNGKMSEVSAAMGLTGLESLKAFVTANYQNYQVYQEELRGLAGMTLMTYDESESCTFQYIVAEVEEEIAGLSRDELVDILHAENVLARRYFSPGCHRMEPYRSDPAYADCQLPKTDKCARRVLALPTGSAVGPQEVHVICQMIRFVLARANHLRRRMASQPGTAHGH